MRETSRDVYAVKLRETSRDVYAIKLNELFRTVTREAAGVTAEDLTPEETPSAGSPTGIERRRPQRRTPFFNNTQVARLAGGGITQQTIGSIRKGRFGPSTNTLIRIARAFGIDPAYWWAESDDVEPFLLSLRVPDDEPAATLESALRTAAARAEQLFADLQTAALRATDQPTQDALRNTANKIAAERDALHDHLKQFDAELDAR